jgi:hypothetical protein
MSIVRVLKQKNAIRTLKDLSDRRQFLCCYRLNQPSLPAGKKKMCDEILLTNCKKTEEKEPKE